MSPLFCACGRQFYPMGVEPGQLASCPACGSWLRVPEVRFTPNDAVARLLAEAGSRCRRRRTDEIRLRDCLLYPIQDGPGVALLVFLPPFVWFLSVPAFDIIRFAWPKGVGGDFNPFALLIAPAAIPLGFSFAMTLGYILLFLGGVLVASALGEEMHPNWPWWDFHAIGEGLVRWLWAAIVGLAVGAFPMVLYWIYCGDIDLFDRIILAELMAIGVGYAEMALAASLLHDSLAAAHPMAVARAIWRLRWSYLRPSLVGGFALALVGAGFYLALFRAQDLRVAAVGLWAAWVFALYAAMVVMRLLGLTYFRHAEQLGWFRARPKWAVWGRQGKIYANS